MLPRLDGLGGDEPQCRRGRYGDPADRPAPQQAPDPGVHPPREVSFEAGQVQQPALEEPARDVGRPRPDELGADRPGEAVVEVEVGDTPRTRPEAVLVRPVGPGGAGAGTGQRDGGALAVRAAGVTGARIAGDEVDRPLTGRGDAGGCHLPLGDVRVDLLQAAALVGRTAAYAAQGGRLHHRLGAQSHLDQSGPAVRDVEEVDAFLAAGAAAGQGAQRRGLGDAGDLGIHTGQVGGVSGLQDARRLVLHQRGQLPAHPVPALPAVRRVVELGDRQHVRLAELAAPDEPAGKRDSELMLRRARDSGQPRVPRRHPGHGLGGSQVRQAEGQVDRDRHRGEAAEADGVPGHVAHAPLDGHKQRQVVADPPLVARLLRGTRDLRTGVHGADLVGAAGLGVPAARVGLVDQEVGRRRGRLQGRELEVALMSDPDAALPARGVAGGYALLGVERLGAQIAGVGQVAADLQLHDLVRRHAGQRQALHHVHAAQDLRCPGDELGRTDRVVPGLGGDGALVVERGARHGDRRPLVGRHHSVRGAPGRPAQGCRGPVDRRADPVDRTGQAVRQRLLHGGSPLGGLRGQVGQGHGGTPHRPAHRSLLRVSRVGPRDDLPQGLHQRGGGTDGVHGRAHRQPGQPRQRAALVVDHVQAPPVVRRPAVGDRFPDHVSGPGGGGYEAPDGRVGPVVGHQQRDVARHGVRGGARGQQLRPVRGSRRARAVVPVRSRLVGETDARLVPGALVQVQGEPGGHLEQLGAVLGRHDELVEADRVTGVPGVRELPGAQVVRSRVQSPGAVREGDVEAAAGAGGTAQRRAPLPTAAGLVRAEADLEEVGQPAGVDRGPPGVPRDGEPQLHPAGPRDGVRPLEPLRLAAVHPVRRRRRLAERRTHLPQQPQVLELGQDQRLVEPERQRPPPGRERRQEPFLAQPCLRAVEHGVRSLDLEGRLGVSDALQVLQVRGKLPHLFRGGLVSPHRRPLGDPQAQRVVPRPERAADLTAAGPVQRHGVGDPGGGEQVTGLGPDAVHQRGAADVAQPLVDLPVDPGLAHDVAAERRPGGRVSLGVVGGERRAARALDPQAAGQLRRPVHAGGVREPRLQRGLAVGALPHRPARFDHRGEFEHADRVAVLVQQRRREHPAVPLEVWSALQHPLGQVVLQRARRVLVEVFQRDEVVVLEELGQQPARFADAVAAPQRQVVHASVLRQVGGIGAVEGEVLLEPDRERAVRLLRLPAADRILAGGVHAHLPAPVDIQRVGGFLGLLPARDHEGLGDGDGLDELVVRRGQVDRGVPPAQRPGGEVREDRAPGHRSGADGPRGLPARGRRSARGPERHLHVGQRRGALTVVPAVLRGRPGIGVGESYVHRPVAATVPDGDPVALLTAQVRPVQLDFLGAQHIAELDPQRAALRGARVGPEGGDDLSVQALQDGVRGRFVGDETDVPVVPGAVLARVLRQLAGRGRRGRNHRRPGLDRVGGGRPLGGEQPIGVRCLAGEGVEGALFGGGAGQDGRLPVLPVGDVLPGRIARQDDHALVARRVEDGSARQLGQHGRARRAGAARDMLGEAAGVGVGADHEERRGEGDLLVDAVVTQQRGDLAARHPPAGTVGPRHRQMTVRAVRVDHVRARGRTGRSRRPPRGVPRPVLHGPVRRDDIALGGDVARDLPAGPVAAHRHTTGRETRAVVQEAVTHQVPRREIRRIGRVEPGHRRACHEPQQPVTGLVRRQVHRGGQVQDLPRQRHRIRHGPQRFRALDGAPHQPAQVRPRHRLPRGEAQHVGGERGKVLPGQPLEHPVERRQLRVRVQRQPAVLGLVRLPGRVEQHPADVVRGRCVIAGALMTRVNDQVQMVQGERARHPQMGVGPAHVLQRADPPQQRPVLALRIRLVRLDLRAERPAQGPHQPQGPVLDLLGGRT